MFGVGCDGCRGLIKEGGDTLDGKQNMHHKKQEAKKKKGK